MSYAREAASAKRLIERKGAAFTLTRNPEAVDTGASENPWDADFTDQTGEGGNDEAETYTAPGVILPERAGRDDAFEDAAAIETKARRVYLAASGLAITPQPGDKLTAGGQTYQVIGVSTLAPDAGDPILHRLTVTL